MNLKELFDKVCEDQKWSRTKLSEYLGISKMTMSNYYNNKSEPKDLKSLLDRISELGYHITVLVNLGNVEVEVNVSEFLDTKYQIKKVI